MSQITFSTIDRLSLPTRMTINVSDDIEPTDVQNLADELNAFISGADVKAVITYETIVDTGSQEPPTLKSANRGNKWLFRSQVGSKVYHNQIGVANAEKLPSSGSDYVDLSTGDGATLKAAWDAVYTDANGDPGTLLSIQSVERTG